MNKLPTRTDRDASIDIAKGIGILLIAFWHSELRLYFPRIHEAQQLFSVQAFFLISGVFIKTNKTFFKFAAEKARALLKPYFALFALVSLLAFWRVNYISPLVVWKQTVLANGMDLPQGFAPLWFLPHTFLALLCAFMLIRLFTINEKASTLALVGLIIVLHVVGVVFLPVASQIHVMMPTVFQQPLRGLPWNIDILPMSTALVLAGALISQHRQRLTSPWVFAIAIAALAALVISTPTDVDLNGREFAPPALATLGSVLGNVCLLSVSGLLAKVPFASRVLGDLIGKRSIQILCFHMALGSGLYYIAAHRHWVSNDLTLAVICYAFSVGGALLLGYLVSHTPIVKFMFQPGLMSSYAHRSTRT